MSDTTTISARIPAELKAQLEEVAEKRGTTVSALLELGVRTIVYLPPKSWEDMTFRKERTRRRLSIAQQIVDIVSDALRARRRKWDKEGGMRSTERLA